MITVTLLGTGALSPTPERALAVTALTVSGRTLLVDCGEGTQIAMRRHHVSPLRVDVIALTHYHGDHILGLPGLMQTMFQEQRRTPLLIVGPGNAAEQLAPIMTLAGKLPYDVFVRELPPEGLKLDQTFPGWADGTLLSAFPTNHTDVSQGYCLHLPRRGKFDPALAAARNVPQKQWGRLQKGEAVTLPDGRTILPEQVMGPARRGLTVTVSGDTSPCPALTEAAKDADLLIMDGTYADDEDTAMALSRGHSTFALAARTAKEASARRLWLTHFSQSVTEPERYLPPTRTIFENSFCGTDGLSDVLRFDS